MGDSSSHLSLGQPKRSSSFPSYRSRWHSVPSRFFVKHCTAISRGDSPSYSAKSLVNTKTQKTKNKKDNHDNTQKRAFHHRPMITTTLPSIKSRVSYPEKGSPPPGISTPTKARKLHTAGPDTPAGISRSQYCSDWHPLVQLLRWIFGTKAVVPVSHPSAFPVWHDSVLRENL